MVDRHPVPSARATVLVVDDDAKIRALVTAYLEREGFAVLAAADGQEALDLWASSHCDFVVLDLMLPVVDGYTVLRRVRETSEVPILVLSARGSTADRVLGIHEGADDYLPKPFSPAELVVRVKAILRRTRPHAESAGAARVEHGDLVIDGAAHRVLQGTRTVPLSALELHLLTTIISARGRVLSRDQLMDAIYGEEAVGVLDRTIDVHIRRIREKLHDDPAKPRYIATVRSVGYGAAPVP